MNRDELKVAIVDNSVDSSVYDPIRHWTSYLEVTWEAFKATKHHFPDLKNEYTHIILTGSEASILERESWAYEEIELIHEGVERGIPILGSCYGHQLLAVALAGSSHVQRSPNPEIGWIPVRIKEDNQLLGEKDEVFSFSSHFDEVINLSEDFFVFADSDNCDIQGFKMKDRPVWGLQMHPEISIQEAQMFLRNLIALGLKTTPFFEKALNSNPNDSGLIHRIIKKFVC